MHFENRSKEFHYLVLDQTNANITNSGPNCKPTTTQTRPLKAIEPGKKSEKKPPPKPRFKIKSKPIKNTENYEHIKTR